MNPLAAMTVAHTPTREALRRVSAHILARRRADVTGRIGLRPAPGGVGTPAFGDDVEVVRIDGPHLVLERGASTTAVGLTSLADLAVVVGVDLAGPVELGGDPPPVGDPTAPLAVDPAAARAIGAWFGFVASVLDEVLAAAREAAWPSVVQLWPEHFDLACDVAWGPDERARVNLGGSPGDAGDPEPYLYVGPWTEARPDGDGYWNAPFGAVLPHARLREADDGWAAHRMAVDFLTRGLDLLRRG